MIDLSFLIGAAIAIMIAFVLYKAWPAVKAFIPAGALYFINWFAEVVVNAIESEMDGEEGEKKREEAFKRINEALAPMIAYMEKFGYTISAERIYEAIQAAWIKLDMAEIQTGVKYIEFIDDDEEDKPPEDTETIED